MEINLVRTKGLVQEEKEGVTTREEWSCPVPVACRSFLFGKVFHVVLDSPPPQVAAAVPANHGAPSRTRNVHPVLLPPRANGAAAHPQTEPHRYVGQGFLPSPPQARVGSLPAVTLEIVQHLLHQGFLMGFVRKQLLWALSLPPGMAEDPSGMVKSGPEGEGSGKMA